MRNLYINSHNKKILKRVVRGFIMAKDIGLADFFQSAQDFPKRVELITELEQDPLLLFEMQFDDKSIQFYFSNN